MTEWTHRTLTVPTAQVEFARLLTETIAGPAGAGMWTTPLSPTGELPATHWISSGLIDQQFADLLSQPAVCVHLASEAGLSVTAEEVANLLAVADISEEAAFAALARLGLQLANSPDLTE
jgi:hypothetical protein